MKEEEQVDVVRNGYNKIASLYHSDRHKFDISPMLQSFIKSLKPGGHILDAGCGAGVPVAKTLVNSGFNVTGIDISKSMLELASRHVPDATFLLQDMTKPRFENGTFDGVISVFALIHVPRTLHRNAYKHFFRYLKSGGIMLVSTGSTKWEGVEEYYGHQMFWSHYDSETSLEIVKDIGFTIIWDGVIETGDERPYWIFSMK